MTVRLALRTVSLESRRSGELARLLERHGLVPIAAPSLREVPLEDQTDALAFGEALFSGGCDALLLLTGVGTRALVAALETRRPKAQIVEALRSVLLVCRGPKPAAALKELGIKPGLTAPEPNTWRDLLSVLSSVELQDKRVWVQEYGRPNLELMQALRARGATVHAAPVYAWQLPEDVAPLERAIAALCNAEADAIVFTSAQQIVHVLEVARRLGREDALSSALRRRVLVASIGPVTSAALAEHGFSADVEPEHPKMGHLVKALVEDGLEALERKQRSAPA